MDHRGFAGAERTDGRGDTTWGVGAECEREAPILEVNSINA